MENDYSRQFGRRLQKVVGDHSKLQIANDLGCSDVTVRFWLKGKIPFAIFILRELHEVYNVDLNELIAGDKKCQKQK